MRFALLLTVPLLLTGCAGPATGPVKGVLVVYPSGIDMEMLDSILNGIQLQVTTVEPENVFDFSICSMEEFSDDLRTRRTILFLVNEHSRLPDDLRPSGTPDGPPSGGIFSGEDLWARGQTVLGVVLPEFHDYSALSRRLETVYEKHLRDYIYGSFVSTQMSSPARIDSLLDRGGFSMDVPKSYSTAEWDPRGGFIQYSRRVSDQCLLLLSVRWISDDVVLSPEEAVTWREAVARNHFNDARADSVDRSSVQVEPLVLHGLQGWMLLGMWRNPEHLNAGAFTSYVLRSDGVRYLLDMEVFHERREKEPYIREGWIIMNTFILGEENGQ